jgi:hypothetical protein
MNNAGNKNRNLIRKEISAIMPRLLTACALAFASGGVNGSFVETHPSPRPADMAHAGILITTVSDDVQPVFTGIRASWNVPDISKERNNPAIIVYWIGISDRNGKQPIQAGTLCNGNGCALFYELLPKSAKIFYELPVNWGDLINAHISKVKGNNELWLIELNDSDKKITINETVEYHTSMQAVQFIAETPTVVRHKKASISKLPFFGKIAFLNCSIETAKSAPTESYKFEIAKDGIPLTKTEAAEDNSIIMIRQLRR